MFQQTRSAPDRYFWGSSLIVHSVWGEIPSWWISTYQCSQKCAKVGTCSTKVPKNFPKPQANLLPIPPLIVCVDVLVFVPNRFRSSRIFPSPLPDTRSGKKSDVVALCTYYTYSSIIACFVTSHTAPVSTYIRFTCADKH